MSLRDEVTPLEWEIVKLTSFGYRGQDVASILGTTHNVIKNYLTRIYEKTGTSDRLELAVRFAWERADRARNTAFMDTNDRYKRSIQHGIPQFDSRRTVYGNILRGDGD